MKTETLEHALAEAIARRLTGGNAKALQCRLLVYEAALEGFQLGILIAAQLLAERAAKEDSELLREVEQQVRAVPGDPAHPP